MIFESSVPLPAALAVAATIALSAYRGKSLTPSGAAAAIVTGTVALAHSLGWGTFLIIWFLLAALLSRTGRTRKALQVREVVEKGDRRDARQVLANGGLFAAGAMALKLGAVSGSSADIVAVAAASALVAAGADTWATELGTLGGGRPWSLRERRRVAVGTSGAVTLVGSIASVTGAFLLASLAGALGVVPHAAVFVVAVAGAGGAFADTMVGAWWQERRWCPACSTPTEQRVHRCGTPTVHRGGIGGVTNDLVNLACTASGAAIAMLLWYARAR